MKKGEDDASVITNNSKQEEHATTPPHEEDKKANCSDHLTTTKPKNDQPNNPLRGSFWLTRIIMVRYMGFLYGTAFIVSLFQNKELIGERGLLPADTHLDNVKEYVGERSSVNSFTLMSYAPSLLWFVDYHQNLNLWLDSLAWVGLAISIFMMVKGSCNWILLLLEWIIYHSLVNVGQRWFSFGWESQILETGFLMMFLCPMLSLSSMPSKTPTSFVGIMAFRWLIFRIMIGAGLIKLRGDKCWRDLTCMNFHYETQPVPNPLSYYLHQSPESIHKLEVLSNHFIELMAPFLLLLPRNYCMIGGCIQILFQLVLIISGNLSFLNWLTIMPSLACFDDASVAWLFGSIKRARAMEIVSKNTKRPGGSGTLSVSQCIRRVFNIGLGLLIAHLSVPVVLNLLSSDQAMNTSFDPLRLVNTYGAFGSVTKRRTEVIIQGTSSLDPSSSNSTVWEEYEFHCKPGNVYRRPCVISPYHYRLDWLMWFAAFQDYQHNPWMIHLAGKLLTNDNITDSLMSYNPFKDKSPPRFIRAEHYRYSYTTMFSTEAKKGMWWKRKRVGNYLPVVSMDSLAPIYKEMKWKVPTETL